MKRNTLEEIIIVDVNHDQLEKRMEISLPKNLKHYQNPKTWEYIVFEIISQIQKEYQSFYRIKDEVEIGHQSRNPQSICILENGIFSFTNPYSKQMLLDFFSSIWSYEGLVEIFCSSRDATIESYGADYMYKIVPFNDGESIEICYTSDSLAEELKKLIIEIIEPYGIRVNLQITS